MGFQQGECHGHSGEFQAVVFKYFIIGMAGIFEGISEALSTTTWSTYTCSSTDRQTYTGFMHAS